MLYIVYGYYKENKDWDTQLEESYMTKNKLEYSPNSKLQVEQQNARNGYKPKGCIARNMS